MSLSDELRRPLAYLNERFVTSDEARPLRILAEYLEPLERFRRERIHDTIVFFGSARLAPEGPLGRFYHEARELARLVTVWSKGLPSHEHRYVVCSGGGGGIMEAANRGASDAGGRTVGLNIGLPHEQRPNPYITRELSFEFHYFFMRKLWFAHLARALVVFPGGFGTLDELTEILTLAQTRKLSRGIPVILYGSGYWKEIINFEALVRYGMIARYDLDLFQYADDPDAALAHLKSRLGGETETLSGTPSFAHSHPEGSEAEQAQAPAPDESPRPRGPGGRRPRRSKP
ncbi:MAG TPA: TIGR00730 family Rossman fold protein [Steroidobacteraceae bacterium]|nr:TIGR00730 family Rossman fold protein [Steroidobacteraceae bacterium]